MKIENKESGRLAKRTVGAAPGHVARVNTNRAGGGDARPCTHCGRKSHGSGKPIPRVGGPDILQSSASPNKLNHMDQKTHLQRR